MTVLQSALSGRPEIRTFIMQERERETDRQTDRYRERINKRERIRERTRYIYVCIYNPHKIILYS